MKLRGLEKPESIKMQRAAVLQEAGISLINVVIGGSCYSLYFPATPFYTPKRWNLNEFHYRYFGFKHL